MAGETMGVVEFGRALVKTQDLDPVYVAIWGAKLPEPQLCRLLLAYWCFYHLGAAAWLSQWEGEEFWTFMGVAAINNRREGRPCDMPCPMQFDAWPRAAERRHFRGQKCVTAVAWLRDQCPGDPQSGHGPEEWVRMLSCSPLTERAIMDTVQGWPMFGPWIAFKVADMMERVYGAQVRFDPDLGLMYEEPRRALDLLAVGMGPGEPPIPGVAPGQRWWYAYLGAQLRGLAAPPAHDRPCGPQEVETVLCKWKSHANGHYWVGKDTHEVRHGLRGWGDTAERLLAACPREVAR